MSVVYNIYKADYNPNQDWRNTDPLIVSFDQLNKQFDWDDAMTADQKFQRVVHRSIDHLYYRDFYSNNKASFGSGNINRQFRYLEDQAYVISLPQSKFGESILPGSVAISMSMLTTWDDNSAGGMISTIWGIEDDSFGNLVIKSGYTSPYDGTLWTGATHLTASTVGEWPSPNVYKYIQAGKVSFVEDFNEGLWSMTTEYNNVYAGYLSVANSSLNGYAPGALNQADYLGAAWLFSRPVSSSIVIKPGLVPDYMHSYNFENGDFTIALIARPNGLQTSGTTLLAKEGPIEELRTDENGTPYTQTNTCNSCVNVVNTKSPYRLTCNAATYTFERDGGDPNRYAAVSASFANANTPALVIISKQQSTSTISIEVHDAEGTVQTQSAVYDFSDQFCINPSYIYIGNSYTGANGFNGYIDNIKFFKKILTQADKDLLKVTMGVGNLNVGNVFYNHITNTHSHL